MGQAQGPARMGRMQTPTPAGNDARPAPWETPRLLAPAVQVSAAVSWIPECMPVCDAIEHALLVLWWYFGVSWCCTPACFGSHACSLPFSPPEGFQAARDIQCNKRNHCHCHLYRSEINSCSTRAFTCQVLEQPFQTSQCIRHLAHLWPKQDKQPFCLDPGTADQRRSGRLLMVRSGTQHHSAVHLLGPFGGGITCLNPCVPSPHFTLILLRCF